MRNLKSKFYLTAILALLTISILAGGLINSAYAGKSYATNTVKIGAGHFAYGETAGDLDNGTTYTLTDRVNYHTGLYMLTGRVMLGYVPAKYSYTGITGNVDYELNDFSAGAGIDPRMLNGYMQNQLYVSLGQFTNSFMAANSSFTGGVQGYDEYYTVEYLGLTYKNVYAFNRRFSNVLKLNYVYGLSGTATTKHYALNINGYPEPNLTNILGRENAYTVAEGARYRLTNDFSLVGDIYYSALFLKNSNTANYTYEPSSMTHQYGLQFGVRCAF